MLYAPTWRDSTNKGKSYDLNVPIDLKKWEQQLGDRYVLLFRAHDRTTAVMNIQYNNFVRNYCDYADINDLYIAADLLITDYSSVIFDYSILGKPLFCFAYDYEDYKKERGMYFNPEEVYPGGVIRTEDALLARIQQTKLGKDQPEILAFNQKFMEYGKGEATRTCVERLFEK
jgi:CDP-glycerol glycerophosphotransferase